MANRIVSKWHLPQALAFDGSPQEVSIAPPNPIAAGNNRNSPSGQFNSPIACKIPLVGIFFNLANPAIAAFNITIGAGAPATTGFLVADDSDVRFPPTVNSAQGLSLFMDQVNGGALDQVLNGTTIVAPFSGGVFPTPEPDAIFPAGVNFTFRYAGLAGGTSALAKVVLMLIPVNIRSLGSNPWTWGNSNVG